jgi:cell division protein FtsB
MKGRAGVVVAALALMGVLALSVFPAKAWLDQRDNRKALAAQDAQLGAENHALQARVDHLRTDEEIERLARQYNLVKPGEESYFIRPDGRAPATTVPPEPEPEPKRSKSLLDRIASIF